MQINFYEEFPTQKNLQKLKLIKFPTKIFVAAKTLKEFKRLEKQIKKIKPGTNVAYWPVVPNSYWISPFSNTSDIVNLFKELETIDNDLLIDLELPIKRRFIIKNIFLYFKNRTIIKNFLIKHKKRITTAQFPSSYISFIMKIFGLDYNVRVEKSYMWYSSMLPTFINKNIKKTLLKLKNKQDYSISLGTIATGILGDEPILPPSQLQKDLEFAKKGGFKKIIIFRLEGLNKKYVEVINKFK